MMKWQLAAEAVGNGDGTCDDVRQLFDKVRQLDATAQNVANVQRDQLMQQHDTFVDDVLIATFITVRAVATDFIVSVGVFTRDSRNCYSAS